MSLAVLQAALDTLDDQIAILVAKAAGPNAYTIEGLSVAKAKISELLSARRQLMQAINDAAGPYEVHSTWVPS